MGRTKAKSTPTKTNKITKTLKSIKASKDVKRQYEGVDNPGLKAINLAGNKLLSEKYANKNDDNLQYTRNANQYPKQITKSDMEWKAFGKLVKRNIKSRLENIAISTIKYTKLPEGYSKRVIEYGFLTRGYCIAFNDPEEGNCALPSIPNFFNINGDPTYANAYGFGGYFKTIHCTYKGKEKPSVVPVELQQPTILDGVICRDNDYGTNNAPKLYIDYINEYTEILSNLKLAMLVSAERLKQPYIIVAKKQAMKNQVNKILQKVRDNERDVIFIDEIIRAEDRSIRDVIDVIDLKGDNESPKKLQELWENQFNNFLSLFGINTNPTPDKSQYVNSPEINSNNELLKIEADIRFQNRKEWCKNIKDILGLEMEVELNQDDDLMNSINQMKGELGNGATGNKSYSE